MVDYNKIVSHPERDKIIEKLVSGDSPKDVAQYLKIKYNDKEEGHLRLSSGLLKDFVDNYLSKHKYIQQIAIDNKQGKINKKIAESLLNNKVWRERFEEKLDEEIDIKKRIQQLIFLLEARLEQVFDQIQNDPQNFKGDYVLNKHFSTLFDALEKADKIINERPDTLIQTDITINMVEQHSAVFQEAIREVLAEMDPEVSTKFMDLLSAKLTKLQAHEPSKRTVDVKTLPGAFEEDLKFEDLNE